MVIIRNLYKDSTCNIKQDGTTGDWFKVVITVCQGCVLPLLLFALTIDAYLHPRVLYKCIIICHRAFFTCRLHSLELFLGFHPGPNHQCRLFQTFA